MFWSCSVDSSEAMDSFVRLICCVVTEHCRKHDTTADARLMTGACCCETEMGRSSGIYTAKPLFFLFLFALNHVIYTSDENYNFRDTE